MGATGWSFIVPYQPDMVQVLEDLKQAEFEGGECQRPEVEWDAFEMFGLEDARDEDELEKIITEYGLEALRRPLAEVGVSGFRAWLKALDQVPAVATREDLDVLQQFSSSGTGTILDITHIAATPEFGALFPLSPEQLLPHFGTAQPTRTQFEQSPSFAYARFHKRGQGCYFVLYKDGQTYEIYIEGSSGD